MLLIDILHHILIFGEHREKKRVGLIAPFPGEKIKAPFLIDYRGDQDVDVDYA